MRTVAAEGLPTQASASAVVLLALEPDQPHELFAAGGLMGLPDEAVRYFANLLEAGELPCQLGKTNLFHQVPGISAKCVVVVGGGKLKQFDERAAFRAAGAASKRLAERSRDIIHFDFGRLEKSQLEAAVAGSLNGGYGQDLFRAEKNLKPANAIAWHNATANGLARGQILGDAILLTRELVNLPPNYMFPEEFTRRAANVSVSSGFELEVWDELRLRREGCGALLGVSAGSTRPPRLLVMRYRGTKKQPPLALVGKGVTFDSGGLSIKPTDGMLSMKCDMAGAATVLGTMQAISRMQLAAPVVGLVGLVENMISGSCLKLGDVLTSRSGKTIEIHNTDAEGRLVLADVLNVALDEHPAQIIDLATLTGACVVALGLDISGLMSNNSELQSRVQLAAAQAGEEVWPLPMSEHFADQIRSKVADIKNVGEGRWGGAITAAKFLQEFVADLPWLHIDIAGPAFADSPKAYIDAGGSGVMVRTLVNFIETL